MSNQASLAAFEAFAAVERGKALRYTTAWVGWEAAQDVVQDGLVVVWKKWDALANPAAYLYRTCRQLAFAEYETRSRGPVLLAELPEHPHLDDGQDDEGQAEFIGLGSLLSELMDQNWSSPHALTVAAGLALGDSRGGLAEYLGTPVSEVHRSARELRRYFKANRDSPGPATKEAAYTPHGLVMKAMRRLTRRERQVMALAAIGLQPQLIAPLIGITGASARTTLCHARKSVAHTIGLVVHSESQATGDVDDFVRASVDAVELLGLLPNFAWKPQALSWAATADWDLAAYLKAAGPNARYGPRGLVPYLKMISKVQAVARDGLEAARPAAVYGSVRWLPFGVRFRAAFVGEPLVYAAAYRRMQATDDPAAWSPRALAGRESTTVGVPDFSCPVPSWPARPPQYLAPAPYPRFEPYQAAGAKLTVMEPVGLAPGLLKPAQEIIETWARRHRPTFVTAA